jgi:hypothetical protein
VLFADGPFARLDKHRLTGHTHVLCRAKARHPRLCLQFGGKDVDGVAKPRHDDQGIGTSLNRRLI